MNHDGNSMHLYILLLPTSLKVKKKQEKGTKFDLPHTIKDFVSQIQNFPHFAFSTFIHVPLLDKASFISKLIQNEKNSLCIS